jgi:hypothetical protein
VFLEGGKEEGRFEGGCLGFKEWWMSGCEFGLVGQILQPHGYVGRGDAGFSSQFAPLGMACLRAC